MSHEALPIDRARFAEALESLPLDTLHSKVAELRNNMNHLRYSNEQMIAKTPSEVEKRGMRWSEAEVEDRQVSEMVNGDSAPTTITQSSQPQSGRLTDEQLRAQLDATLAQDTQDDQEDEGLHL
ncbi:unnamed protein product [Aureobasidium vineae]|uniref:Uncharacterized protein n=1 Tax=Aureobasidium vineae TaxID=2773715 RepID=A0A9N8J8D1_9PEZI|nr:unnamed protein product [Aureobasidium vineae]